jgi:hypothetical protein
MADVISALGISQLEAWQVVAGKWTLQPGILVTEENHYLGPGVEQLHLICMGLRRHESDVQPYGGCGQGIVVLNDGFSGYLITDPETILMRVVAHIRNVHRKLEPEVYGGWLA